MAVIARRGQAVRQAVLDAALAELVDHGYAGLGMDRVAERAGVNKTTVYRRWPDRESLVTDAVLAVAAGDFDIPDTGDVEADLRSMLHALAAWLTGPVGSPLVSMLTSDAARLPAVAQAKRRFFAARADVMRRRVQAAIDAGQLPSETDPMRVLTALVAPIYLNLLVTEQPVTPADCDRAVAVTLHAARAGILT